MLLKIRANRRAMEDRADPLLDRLERLAKEVRRDAHKMHAFVRFRELEDEGGTRFVAFFEPDHHIVRREAGFFVRRFANMAWSILTPELSIHWDRETLREGPGATRADGPQGDPVEETWKTYYASIFNPARVKVKAMLKEMPKKYWANMPETALIAPLLAGAQAREAQMIDRSVAKEGLKHAVAAERALQAGGNARKAWEALLADARGCTRCELYKCGDPDRVRRRPARRAHPVRRRAAGRPGGPCRPPVRRAGGAGVRRRARGGRDRPRRDLRHQRGQAFQVRDARQAPASPDARPGRDQRLPLVDRPGARADPSAADGGAGRHRGPEPVRQGDHHLAHCAAHRSRWRTAANAG